MLTFVAIAVSLSLSAQADYDGPNGLDPAAVEVFPVSAGGSFGIELSTTWLSWFEDDPDRRAETMKYLVQCALKDGQSVSVTVFGRTWTWQGDIGFAPSVTKALDELAKDLEKAPSTKKTKKLEFTSGEAEWVSSCVLALVNTKDRAEYVSLRANPGGYAATRLMPSDAERWTMAYPEGAFLANLFPVAGSSGKPNSDLDRAFTFALNVPNGYDPDEAAWWPPGWSIGRTLTARWETRAENSPPPHGTHRIARRGKRPTGVLVAGLPGGTVTCTPAPAPTDPYYRADSCKVKNGHYRPVYVHLPLTVNVEDAVNATPDPKVRIQALSAAGGLAGTSVVPCSPSDSCTGPFPSLVEGGPPATLPTTPPPAAPSRLTNLGAGQAVAVVLRAAPGLKPAPDKKYTAIVRYRSVAGANAPVAFTGPGGAPTSVAVPWPGARDAWFQVYPVVAAKDDELSGGQLALRITIHGSDNPPELDVAGFVPGRPWCHDDEAKPFAGVCPEIETVARPLVRRLRR